jgi:outer membrane protein TolC
MKNHSILFITCLFTVGLSAQNAVTLSLEDAIARGLEHDYTLKNQSVQIQLAEKDRDKLNSRRSPTITGSSDLRGNPILPTLIIPSSAVGGGSGGESTRRAKFGTFFNWSFTADVKYPILDPTLRSDKLKSENERRLREVTLEKLKTNTRLTIAEAWYDVFLKEEQLKIASEKLRRAQALLEIAQTRQSAGSLLPVDVQRSQLDVDNAQSSVEQARNTLEQSRQNLAYRVGLPLDTPLSLPAPSQPTQVEQTLPTGAQPEQRAELKEEQLRMGMNQIDQNQLRDQYKPTLNAVASGAVQHLSNNFAIWQNWFPIAYFGLQAKVTLFDGQLKRKNLSILELQSQTIQQNIAKYKEDFNYETASATATLKNAIVQWKSAQKNLQTAQQILALDKERFSGGTLLYSEYVNTEYTLRESENNFLTAWYNYLVAKVRWDKSAGKL